MNKKHLLSFHCPPFFSFMLTNNFRLSLFSMWRSSTPFISVFWQQNCCWQIFLLYEMAAVFKCPNTQHRKLFTALFLPNAISRYNAHISVFCLHSRTRKNTRNSFCNAFLKWSPPLLRDLSLSLSLVVVLYAAHYATQFPLTQAVYCQLLVLLTLNFYCCKPLTVREKRNYFLPVDVVFFPHSHSLFRKPYFLELVMKGSLNTSLSSTIKSSSPAGMRRLRYKHRTKTKAKTSGFRFLMFWS